MIQCGKPVLDLRYKTIRYIALGTVLLNIWNIIFCIHLFVSAIKIQMAVGNYINLITYNDGNVLPTLLALSGVLCLPINAVSVYLVYKVFGKRRRSKLNTLMFVCVMTSVGSLFIMAIMCIMVLSHSYGSHEALHNGIVDAMNNYSSNSIIKNRIDLLQIEFQCCGSKHYGEWYDIEWYDTNFVKDHCCAINSIFPCIHHQIDSSDLPYRYSHDLNFSLSVHGCFTKIKLRKKAVAWQITGKLFLMMLFQLAMVIGLRFIQTAHFERCQFDDRKATYTTWLIGWYTGKQPPPVPPVPKELME